MAQATIPDSGGSSLVTNPPQGEAKNQPPFVLGVQPSAVGSADSPYYYGGGGGMPTTGSTPSNDNRSPTVDPILKAAQDQAAAEINAQVNPLQSQISQLQGNQQAAAAAIGQEFAQLLPSVANSASRLEQSNADNLNAAQAIFQQAGSQLNTLQQNAAAQAQRLAQQVGGPVSSGQFTSASDPYAQAAAAGGATESMTQLELGAAGNRAAEVFAGQVFPALATEQQAKNRQYYQDQIKSIQDEITKIQSTKGTLVSSKLATLQAADRQYKLDLANLKLKKINDLHSWDAKARSLEQKDTQLKQYDQRTGLMQDALNQSGYFKDISAKQKQTALQQAGQRIKLEGTRITNQEAQAWARIGVQRDALTARINHYTESDKLANARLNVQQQKNAMSLIDAAMQPGGGKPVKLTTRVNLRADDPAVIAALTGHASAAADVHRDPKTGQWYEYKNMTLTPAQWAHNQGVQATSGVHDPNQLYQLLTSNNTPPAMARNLVRIKTGMSDWAPGQKSSYTAEDLAKMSIPKLDKLARARGFTGDDSTLTKQRAIDFIVSTNP
jgi:hypothetical protein